LYDFWLISTNTLVNFTFKNLQNAVATPDELHQNQVVQFRPECNQFISSVGDSD